MIFLLAQLSHSCQNYPGRLSFATDAWTSPNHRAFVAWTVHLQHEGQPLVFLLDIYEVPEVSDPPNDVDKAVTLF